MLCFSDIKLTGILKMMHFIGLQIHLHVSESVTLFVYYISVAISYTHTLDVTHADRKSPLSIVTALVDRIGNISC